MNKAKKSNSNVITDNRKAFHSYHVDETLEAGIVLCGTEVKSCRLRAVTLTDAYASFQDGELFLHKANIAKYNFGNQFNHDPEQSRKLLLHKRELVRLKRCVEAKGQTLVPLKLYFTRGKVKVQLGLCRGKNAADKRHTVKKREADRDMRRAIKQNL